MTSHDSTGPDRFVLVQTLHDVVGWPSKQPIKGHIGIGVCAVGGAIETIGETHGLGGGCCGEDTPYRTLRIYRVERDGSERRTP